MLGVHVMHEIVQPAEQPLRGRAGDRQAGQRAAQPGHPRGRGEAVAADVADGDEHMTARHLGGDVPVPADPAVAGRGQVTDDGAQPGQVERAFMQGQDRTLQFERDVPLLR